MYNTIIILFLSFFFFGCSKMQDKTTTTDQKAPTQQAPNSPNSGNNSQTENKSSGKRDEKAIELSKTADEALLKYASDKSAAAKDDAIKKCLAAANYIEFDSDLPPREKYRPALKYFRKVLEMDPENQVALKNKEEIEGIYKQMGMPVPQ